MLSVWCALGSLAVLIASVILCATRDTLTSHYAILLCSRFPSRDLYGCHPYHRRGKKPRSRTADQIRPVWFHRSLYYRSVPIFRTNLSRYARRITMAMAIAAPPPIWCIPTPSERPVFRRNFQRLVRGFNTLCSLLCMEYVSSFSRRL